MNTPQLADSLRAAVLQAAIKGELTERSSENACDLLLRIQNEKQALQAKGSLKKTKAPAPVTADEVPFEIPENWVWVRLGEIVTVKGGKRIPAGQSLTTENTGHIYIRVSDMKNGSVSMDNLLYVPKDIYPSIQQYTISAEDLYITCAGTIGRVGEVPKELDGANLTENADKLVLENDINKKWLLLALNSDAVQTQIKDCTTKVGQPKLAIKRIENLLIPLPPLSEQQTIVEKLTRLLAEIDRLKAEEQSLASLQKAYPQTLRASVLAAAVRGDLNERSQEHARDLLLHIQNEKQALQAKGSLKKTKAPAPVTADEVPFEIPENWVWVRLGEIIFLKSGQDLTPSEYSSTPAGIPYITGASHFNNGQLTISRWTEFPKSIAEKGSLLFTCKGTVGEMAFLQEEKVHIARQVMAITSFDGKVELRFIKLILDAYVARIKANAKSMIPGIGRDDLLLLPIPLPPLSDQQAIGAKQNRLRAANDALENA